MKSKTTSAFRKRFAELPPEIQAQARSDYRIFQRDPHYPGLHFQQFQRASDTLYAVRIGIHFRALVSMENGVLYWFWIGHRSVYDKILGGRRVANDRVIQRGGFFSPGSNHATACRGARETWQCHYS